MQITFNHPPVNSNNPFNDFDPMEKSHYPGKSKNGIYIYGFKHELSENAPKKFVPLYVGQGNFFRRLYQDHYFKKIKINSIFTISGQQVDLGENKELWNLSSLTNLASIITLYEQMKEYDEMRRDATQACLTLLSGLSELIYFQNKNFLNLRYQLGFSDVKEDISITEANQYLTQISKGNNTKNHIKAVKDTLYFLSENFYYIYADIPDETDLKLIKGSRIDAESFTKTALKDLKIFTTGSAKKNQKDKSCTIDFSAIQNDLINVGEHSYGNPYDKLIIAMQF